MVYGVVVAGGKGARIGFKKQYAILAHQAVWMHSAEALLAGGVDRLILVFPPEDIDDILGQLPKLAWHNQVAVVAGGETRHASVCAGVQIAVSEHLHDNMYIAIHDAARPFVLPSDVARVIEASKTSGAAVLGQACVDTVKRVNGDLIAETVPRNELFIAQTPQVFSAKLLKTAYLEQKIPFEPTDDASVMEWLGIPVKVVYSTGYNGKVTMASDMELATVFAERRWGGRTHADRNGI